MKFRYKLKIGRHRTHVGGPLYKRGDTFESPKLLDKFADSAARFELLEEVFEDEAELKDNTPANLHRSVPGYGGQFLLEGVVGQDRWYVVSVKNKKRISPRKVSEAGAAALVEEYLDDTEKEAAGTDAGGDDSE